MTPSTLYDVVLLDKTMDLCDTIHCLCHLYNLLVVAVTTTSSSSSEEKNQLLLVSVKLFSFPLILVVFTIFLAFLCFFETIINNLLESSNNIYNDIVKSSQAISPTICYPIRLVVVKQMNYGTRNCTRFSWAIYQLSSHNLCALWLLDRSAIGEIERKH